MDDDEPFVVTAELVVRGGGLSLPWVVQTKSVEDRVFITLKQTCAAFARAMGRPAKAPWAGNVFLNQLQKLRDDCVDEAIMERLKDEDPLADSASTSLKMRGRYQLYQEVGMPQLIELTWPSFITNCGDRIDEHKFLVISTPKRGMAVSMELLPENLQWCKLAIAQCEGEVGVKRPILDEFDLPLLQQPNCKWRRRGDRVAITCRYRTKEGTWHTHSATPTEISDYEMFCTIVRDAEAKVQAFYEQHHVEQEDAEEDPNENDDAEDAPAEAVVNADVQVLD